VTRLIEVLEEDGEALDVRARAVHIDVRETPPSTNHGVLGSSQGMSSPPRSAIRRNFRVGGERGRRFNVDPKKTTKEYERGEIPHCDACERPVGEAVIHDRGPEGEELAFCDAKCREDYFLGLSAADDASEAA
jgi:hypothetical protein